MTTIRSAAELAANAAIASRTEEAFRRSGALKEGHFLLKSGKHSDRYLEKFLVLQDPAATSELCGFWAGRYRAPDGTARREFRRGFTIAAGERVLLVDDILTTGGSLLAMVPAVEALGGEIVGCHVLADRSGGLATLTSPTTGRIYPLRALWPLELPTYEPGPDTCPACKAGLPLHAPGSTGKTAG